LCKIFFDRLRDEGESHESLQLADFAPVRQAYLQGGAEDLRWSLLPVFVVLHADDDGDLVREPRPLPRDGSWPTMTREDMEHF